MDLFHLPQTYVVHPLSRTLSLRAALALHMQSHKSPLAPSLILLARAPSTLASYKTYINKWLKYSSVNKVDPYNNNYNEAMTFWEKLFHKENYNHGTLAVAWSALSEILPQKQGKTFGQEKVVGQMMKGIFRLCLPYIGTQWLLAQIQCWRLWAVYQTMNI